MTKNKIKAIKLT